MFFTLPASCCSYIIIFVSGNAKIPKDIWDKKVSATGKPVAARLDASTFVADISTADITIAIVSVLQFLYL